MNDDAPNAAAELPQKIAARRGFSVLYKGKALLSRIDPEYQAERVITALLPAKERTLYLCPSPLFGYGLFFFSGKLPKNSALLCFETDKALYNWTLANTQFNYSADTLLVYVCSSQELCRLVREHWGERFFRRVEELNLSAGRSLYSDFYDNTIEMLRHEIALAWSNAITLTKLGRLYIRNLFRNLSLLDNSQSLSRLNFGSHPVLITGAGPSLTVMLDTLERTNGTRPYIIAVDTALAVLLARNIYPALTVVLEAQHWNIADFIGWGGKALNIAMDLSALNSQARFAEDRPYFFWTPWTTMRFFSRLKKTGLLPVSMPPLGSVGLCAVSLALRLTCGPVILCGIDFSFTLDGYHARGSPSHRAALRKGGRFGGFYYTAQAFRSGTYTVRSKSGQQVRTDPVMRRYRDLFEMEFGEETKKSRIYEIEGSGLSLGVQTVTLNQAISILKSDNFKPVSGNGTLPASEMSTAIKAKICHNFIMNELKLLTNLRAILTSKRKSDTDNLERLVDELDYLWAHFPDCAATGGRRPPVSDTGFLKRLRAELDPFIALLEKTV